MVNADSVADPSRSCASSKAARTTYEPGDCSSGNVTLALPLLSVTACNRCGPNSKATGRPLTGDPPAVSTAVKLARARYAPPAGAGLKVRLVEGFGALGDAPRGLGPEEAPRVGPGPAHPTPLAARR